MSYRVELHFSDGHVVETFHSKIAWARVEGRKAERNAAVRWVQIIDNATETPVDLHPRAGKGVSR